MDLTELQQQLEQSAQKKLTDISRQFELDHCRTQISVGRAAAEIHRAAEEFNADVIVVGSHGRHGIQLLLGSTANGVLHGAQCDVLAVRIHS